MIEKWYWKIRFKKVDSVFAARTVDAALQWFKINDAINIKNYFDSGLVLKTNHVNFDPIVSDRWSLLIQLRSIFFSRFLNLLDKKVNREICRGLRDLNVEWRFIFRKHFLVSDNYLCKTHRWKQKHACGEFEKSSPPRSFCGLNLKHLTTSGTLENEQLVISVLS